MKPEPSAFTSFCSRIGSPAMNGERAMEPVISLMASALLARLMKLPLAVAAGQVCHCRSSGLTDWPRPISDLATRTSTVGSWATGATATGVLLLLDPLARYAAMPPAPSAMIRTIIRAVYIRFTTVYAGDAGTARELQPRLWASLGSKGISDLAAAAVCGWRSRDLLSW